MLNAGRHEHASEVLARRAWLVVTAVVIVVAVVSLASNWVSVEELEGGRPVTSLLRKTVSMVVNSGTLWAGLAVLAGWAARRPLTAGVAGVLVSEAALVLHYGLGQALGMYDSEIWGSNLSWFVAGATVCAPLGLVGLVARRRGLWGLAARLVLPLGALAEPWVTGMFTGLKHAGWPERWSSIACGVLLLVCGGLGVLVVLLGALRRRRD